MFMLIPAVIAVLPALIQNPAGAGTEIAAAIVTLRKVDMVVVGPHGLVRPLRPRAVHRGERALVTVMKAKNAASLLKSLMTDADPAGQLYALLGTRFVDPKAYQERLKALKASGDRVPTIVGCLL